MDKITVKRLKSDEERKKIYDDIAFLIYNEKNEEKIKELSNYFYEKSAIYSDKEYSYYSFGFYILLNSFFVEKEEYSPLKALKYAKENKEEKMIDSLSQFARYAVRVRNVQHYSIEPESSLETLWLYSLTVIKHVVESYK